MKRPSPSAVAAIVIATLSLAVAAGGVGYAASKISGSQIKKGSIAGNRLKNNTLTGKQIKESTLGTVPLAKHASTASAATAAGTALTVDGNGVGSFSVNVASGGATQTVTLPGVVLSASCPAGSPTLTAAASATGESIVISYRDSTGTAGTGADNSFATDATDALTPVSAAAGVGTAVVTRASNSATTVTYSYDSKADNSCTYSGTAVATAG